MPYTLGDWVGNFKLASADGKMHALGDRVGVPHVLLFLSGDHTSDDTILRSFVNLHGEFASLNTPLFALRCPGDPPSNTLALSSSTLEPENAIPFPLLTDADGKVTNDYAATGQTTVLLDLNGRVSRIYSPIDPVTHAVDVLADVKAMLNVESPRQVLQQAPVLLIPNVLPREFCEELMDVWRKEGNQESGQMVVVDGKTVGIYDHSHKIRRDHFVANGSPLDKRIGEFLGRRLVREVDKAFSFQVSRKEDLKIACYDSTRGGYFRPHRDNTTPATAHRRFACSLLLNDDYEGGYIRFPEYGPHLYRPKAGGAVIFGCSLLHEATDVTAGQRFVLLTFLFGEREAKMREEYSLRTGGKYRA